MDQVYEFFKKLMGSSDWPPRWHCGNWTDFHGWLYITSDLMVWSAYFAIPIIIIKYISKRRDIRFNRVYLLFAAFILACGSTHLLDAMMFWIPAYRLNALVRFITGVVSWLTVYHLIKILPKAFSMKSSQQLEAEVKKRKEVEDELRRINYQLNEAQEIAKLGNWEWNVNDDRISWSAGIFRVLDQEFNNKQLFFHHFMEMVHPAERERVRILLEDARSKGKFNDFHFKVLLAGGQIKMMHARGDVVRNEMNEVKSIVGTIQDVTVQKIAEQEIMIKSSELEAVNKELQQFADIASHDLQEPLRKIVFYSSLLEKECKGTLGINGELYIEKLINSSGRMQNLINDILNLSKLSVSEITFKKVNLGSVIQEVLTDMEVIIERTGAHVQVETMPSIEVNASQFGQLFQNLISNAIKFTKPGTRPVIRIYSKYIASVLHPVLASVSKLNKLSEKKQSSTMLHDGQSCMIYVADNGIGFDERYLDRLFVIFQRLHGKSTYEGTGIGLAICKKVVDNHHGCITAKSVSGEGSTFIVTVPILQNVYG